MYFSPYCRLDLVPPYFMKFGLRGQLTDIITCVKFLSIGPGVTEFWYPNIAISHWLSASPLQQCTHCRATLWYAQMNTTNTNRMGTPILVYSRSMLLGTWPHVAMVLPRKAGINANERAVVKVREGKGGGAQPLLRFEPPCNSMSPVIESIECYFMSR